MHRGAGFQRSPPKGRGPVVALVVFSWCGSCKAPRELENPSSLSFQLVRVAENGPRARFPSFPDLHTAEDHRLDPKSKKLAKRTSLARRSLAYRPKKPCLKAQGAPREYQATISGEWKNPPTKYSVSPLHQVLDLCPATR